MSWRPKFPSLARPDGSADAQAVTRNFEDFGARFPLAPTSANFSIAPQARAYNSASLSTTSGADTTLTFNSERWDYVPAGLSEQHSTSSNTSRLTCRVPGLYSIAGHVRFDANATGVRRAQIRYTASGGGSTYIAFEGRPAASGAATDISVSTLYRLAVGDYVELVAFQNSGGALNVIAAANYSPELAFVWLSP